MYGVGVSKLSGYNSCGVWGIHSMACQRGFSSCFVLSSGEVEYGSVVIDLPTDLFEQGSEYRSEAKQSRRLEKCS